jgi:hypothetical protein
VVLVVVVVVVMRYRTSMLTTMQFYLRKGGDTTRNPTTVATYLQAGHAVGEQVICAGKHGICALCHHIVDNTEQKTKLKKGYIPQFDAAASKTNIRRNHFTHLHGHPELVRKASEARVDDLLLPALPLIRRQVVAAEEQRLYHHRHYHRHHRHHQPVFALLGT